MTIAPGRRNPFWLGRSQPYAEAQLKASHADALYQLGEYVLFILMWHEMDFEAGLVARCSTCMVSSREAVAFDQPTSRRCLDCYGTTYEGGFMARIFRPALITDRATVTTDESQRGAMQSDTLQLETTNDFTIRSGDYMVRTDGLRYQTNDNNQLIVRSGFDFPNLNDVVSNNAITARLEQSTSVAYLIPPDTDTIRAALATSMSAEHLPPDLSALEVIRAPLV